MTTTWNQAYERIVRRGSDADRAELNAAFDKAAEMQSRRPLSAAVFSIAARIPRSDEQVARAREQRLRRAVAKTGHTLHKARGVEANWRGHGWFMQHNYTGAIVEWDASLERIEYWLAHPEKH